MSSILSLKDILDNTSRDLVITGIGTVKVRDPTTRDRIESRQDAKKDSRWVELTEQEKSALVLDLLALKMITEPAITLEEYYKANSVTLSNIIDAVIMDYTLRFRKLQGKRSKEIADFLNQTKEDNQKNSTSS
jgi:rRNA maturation endonuclease Nob1